MRIAVLQPSYLPWLGYLDQIASCDAFVFYDDVQYDKNGWRNRNRIRVANGWSWLTIPVLAAGFPVIKDVAIDERVPWRRKHLASLRNAYARAPYFELLDTFISPLYQSGDEFLCNVAVESVHLLMKAFGITTPTFRSSQLNVEGDRNSRLLNLCAYFGANEYLSGVAAQVYLDVELFQQKGVRVIWQDFQHPVYEQQYQPFISHLSAIDALLNAGAIPLGTRHPHDRN